jgi:hypothetical protein
MAPGGIAPEGLWPVGGCDELDRGLGSWAKAQCEPIRSKSPPANAITAHAIGANLIGANLIGANLIGANLIGANLIGAKASAGLQSLANWRFASVIT